MMVAPFTPPFVCPVLIGRTSHLDALLGFMEQACNGHGQAVLIAGEAGVGKSRLVSEATARLRSSEPLAPPAGVLPLVSHCFEQDTALPYAPLLDLLRTFFASRDSDAVAASLVPMAPEFVKLLPELAAFLPDLVRSSALDPEQEKHRLYQALLLRASYCALACAWRSPALDFQPGHGDDALHQLPQQYIDLAANQ